MYNQYKLEPIINPRINPGQALQVIEWSDSYKFWKASHLSIFFSVYLQVSVFSPPCCHTNVLELRTCEQSFFCLWSLKQIFAQRIQKLGMLMLDLSESLSFKLDTFCNKNFVDVVKCCVIYDIYVTG